MSVAAPAAVIGKSSNETGERTRDRSRSEPLKAIGMPSFESIYLFEKRSIFDKLLE
jgi:hypothetical protein